LDAASAAAAEGGLRRAGDDSTDDGMLSPQRGAAWMTVPVTDCHTRTHTHNHVAYVINAVFMA